MNQRLNKAERKTNARCMLIESAFFSVLTNHAKNGQKWTKVIKNDKLVFESSPFAFFHD